jgi:hypothetical protein
MPLTSRPFTPQHFTTRSRASGAGHQADGIEATPCEMRHREAWLLADFWQVWGGNASVSSAGLG